MARIRPIDDPVLRHCKRLVRQNALKAAGVSALPVPGADLFVNGQLLGRTLEQISQAYGLSEAQLARLPKAVRDRADDLAREVGSYLIGRAVTQATVLAALRALGLRVTAQQAAKLAPVVGLAASAAMSGWMFKRLCDRHIKHCQQLRAAIRELPAPPAMPGLPAPTRLLPRPA